MRKALLVGCAHYFATGLVSVPLAMVPGTAAAQTLPATAPTQAKRYDLPPASLASTLDRIAQESGRRILYSPEDVATLRSAGVSGRLTVEGALAAALAGLELSVSARADGTLLVYQGKTGGDILVIGTRDEAEIGFRATRSETATRSGASLREVPGSVTIVTSKVLETQQALSITDGLTNVSGVTLEQSTQGPGTAFLRGFGSTSLTVNGVSDPSALQGNIYTVERIEVLKGPQAILSGADSFGGGVNIVTKKPQAEPLASLLLQYGSYDDKTIAGDLTGGIAAQDRLSGRIIASAAKAEDSFGGYDGRYDYNVLPQVRWKDNGTDILLGGSWSKQYAPIPKYTFARRDGVIVDAPAFRVGAANDGFHSEQWRVFGQLDQTLSRNLVLVSRLQYSDASFELATQGASGLLYDRNAQNNQPNGRVSFFANRGTFDTRAFSGDHYLRWSVKTGPVSHTVSAGVNHSNVTSGQNTYDGPFATVQTYPPDTTYVFPEIGIGDDEAPLVALKSRSRQVAGFAQDLIAWGPVNLVLNLRTTRFTSSSTTVGDFGAGPETSSEPRQSRTHTTPGAGLIVRATSNLSIYASYAEGFSPQFLQSCEGRNLDPLLSRNGEVGVKLDLFGGKLSATGAAFRQSLSNQLQYDQVAGCYTQLGGQRTKGLEFDVQGEIARGWNVLANYTYNRYSDPSEPERIFAGLPEHRYSLWTTYTLQAARWRGLGAGVGVNGNGSYAGSRIARYPYTVPAQTRVDASLFYDLAPWTVTLGVKNLFDKRLYGTASTSVYIPLQPGRTALLTVKRAFR